MFDSIARFMKGLVDPTSQVAFAPDDPRVAAAALLYQTIAVDGRVTEDERDSLLKAIGRLFALDEREARHLQDAGALAEAAAIDPSEFISALKRQMTMAQRLAVVEVMWDLICVDGRIHEFEEDLVWRIARPLGISEDDHDALRAKVEAGRSSSAT